MASEDEMTVRIVTAADVRPLRREVLRVGMPDASVDFDGDDESTTFHLAAVDGTDSIVAVSTWMSRDFVGEFDASIIQLRGMATRSGLQRSGLGSLLITAGCRHAHERGADSIWANARDSALSFYEKHGFIVVGDGFVESVTRLPHHRVVKIL